MSLLMRRRALAAALLAAAAVAPSCGGSAEPGAAPPASEPDVVAWIDGALSRIDPVTLRPKGPTLPTDVGVGSTLSRDGSRLAVTNADGSEVQVVDVERMRPAGPAIEAGPQRSVHTMQWLDATTIAAVAWGVRERLLVLDVPSRRVSEELALPGSVVAEARGPGVLAVLVGPAERIGPSTLVVADAAHGVRRLTLHGVRSGTAPEADPRHRDRRQVAPGLAVDPDGRRAVVVPPAGPVAEIDLESLAVRYHDFVRPASLLDRLRGWLDPAAHAKSLAGPERHASWVGDDAVAVVAIEQVGIRRKGGQYRQLARAAGVELIDTTTWSVRTLSERAGAAAVAANTVLVYGGPFSAGAPFAADDGPPVTGIEAFSAGGARRFRLFASRHVGFVETAGRYAYVKSGAGSVHVVDTRAGHVLRTVRAGMPIVVDP